jgi:FkbM family methyltransferase
MHYDFIEIGTSDFETEIEKCDDHSIGLSIEPLINYLNKLPNKKLVTKVNCAVSDYDGFVKIFYVSEENIQKYNLPEFFKGCNTINKPHPITKGFVFGYNVPDEAIEFIEVEIKSIKTIFQQYNVESIKYLKVDTEGHDCVIINAYFNLCELTNNLFAERILFESNELSDRNEVDSIINKFIRNGYVMESRTPDTILVKIKETI